MSNNHELQDLQLSAANQVVELDDNELDNVTGGAVGGGVMGVISWNQGKRGWDVAYDAAQGALKGGRIGALFGWKGALVGAALSTPKA